MPITEQLERKLQIWVEAKVIEPKRLLTVLFLVILILMLAAPSTACSVQSCLENGIELRRQFVVSVTYADKALPGALVTVTGRGEAFHFSGETSIDGSLHVPNLPAGNFWINVEYLGILAGSQCFHVSLRESKNAKGLMTFEWGDSATSVQRAKGRLLDSQPGTGENPVMNQIHRVNVPIKGVRLKLTNPITLMEYTTISDSEGSFAFDIPEGTYVLHVEGGTVQDHEYDATDEIIEISRKSDARSLLLERKPSGCGGTQLQLRTVDA